MTMLPGDKREPVISDALTDVHRSTMDELGNALRELHDVAVPSADYRYGDRSRRAFDTAAALLKRLGY